MSGAAQDRPVEGGADALDLAATTATDAGSAPYGLTDAGFLPKPYARLVAEGLVLARTLFGPDIDIAKGSVLRTLVELKALEEARSWAALARFHDDRFVATASGAALSALGEEAGLPRPFNNATGSITLSLGTLPPGVTEVVLPRGARLTTGGGHQVALAEPVRLGPETRRREVAVTAFWPGPEHDLNPARPGETIDHWNLLDPKLGPLLALAAGAAVAPEAVVPIEHTLPLSGGLERWPDERYRLLLLRAPRSLWSAEAIRTAVALVPGVRAVQVHDSYGGLDVDRAIFGGFTFMERLFTSERDLGATEGFTVLVAPLDAAIWEGEGGLQEMVAEAIEDLRPIGVVPAITRARSVGIGIRAELVVQGLPLPTGDAATVNASAPAAALKERLLARARRYLDALDLGEPVRAARLTAAFMAEPGIVDVRDLALIRQPALEVPQPGLLLLLRRGSSNIQLAADEVAVSLDDPRWLRIV